MPNFIDDNLNQSVFLNINYLDVLGENTFEYSLYKLLTETLDLEEFENRYKNKTVGRKAYPPALRNIKYKRHPHFENAIKTQWLRGWFSKTGRWY